MDHGYHSHFYHTFFEDYVERARTDNKGTKRVIRTYIGDYYYSCLTVLQRRGVKTAYILLFCLTVFFYLKAAGMPVESNFQWYVTVPEAIDLFLMLWFLKTIIYYVTAKKEMTIGEYKSTSKALMQISAVSAAGFGLTAAVLLVSPVPPAKDCGNRRHSAVRCRYAALRSLYGSGLCYGENDAIYQKSYCGKTTGR